MAAIAELTALHANQGATTEQLVCVGATALWDAALDMTPDIFDPAQALLARAANSAEAPTIAQDPYFIARTYLAQSAIFRAWAEGGGTAVDVLQETHPLLADILDELLLVHPDSTTAIAQQHIAGITYQMLVHRQEDPYHVVLPSPPKTRTGNWRDSNGQVYPPCNRFSTTWDRELLPTIVRSSASVFGNRGAMSGVHYLSMGYSLDQDTGGQLPSLKRAASKVKASHMFIIREVAKRLIDEADGEQLPSDWMSYLGQVGRRLIGKLEGTPEEFTPR